MTETINAAQARSLSASAGAQKQVIQDIADQVHAAASEGRTRIFVAFGRECELTTNVLPIRVGMRSSFTLCNEELLRVLRGAGARQGIRLGLEPLENAVDLPLGHLRAIEDFYAAGFHVEAEAGKARHADPLEFAPVLTGWRIVWEDASARVRTSSWAQLPTVFQIYKMSKTTAHTKEGLKKAYAAIRSAADNEALSVTVGLSDIAEDAVKGIVAGLRESGFAVDRADASGTTGLQISWTAEVAA